MTIAERLSEDVKTAMKARETIRVETLRMVRAQLKDARIAKGSDLTEEEHLDVLSNAAKKRKEAIAMYEKSSRADLLAKEQQELDIISAYLPEQLSQEEIEKVISAVIAETGASTLQDIGKVMGPAMKQLKGKADGKLIQELVRQRLG